MRRKVTVVECVCVCLSVKSLENLFFLKILSPTQQATDIKTCEVFSETAPLQRSSTPSVEGRVQSAIFLQKLHMRVTVLCVAPSVLHYSAFI